jgi:hypothetical protein
MHLYEVRPRKDRCGVDLISDALAVAQLAPTFLGRRLNTTDSFAAASPDV